MLDLVQVFDDLADIVKDLSDGIDTPVTRLALRNGANVAQCVRVGPNICTEVASYVSQKFSCARASFEEAYAENAILMYLDGLNAQITIALAALPKKAFFDDKALDPFIKKLPPMLNYQ